MILPFVLYLFRFVSECVCIFLSLATSNFYVLIFAFCALANKQTNKNKKRRRKTIKKEKINGRKKSLFLYESSRGTNGHFFISAGFGCVDARAKGFVRYLVDVKKAHSRW